MRFLPKRALTALLLCLSFVGLSATPAEASNQSERNRPAGTQSWLPSWYTGKITYTYTDNDNLRHYDIKFTVRWDCDQWGYGDRHIYGLYSPENFRGVEFQADIHDSVITGLFPQNNGSRYTAAGFVGDEGFYLDTTLGDGNTKRFGWGMSNSQNIDTCALTGQDRIYDVTLHAYGPANPPASSPAIVWRASAMHEDNAGNACVLLGVEYCMFGDYQHTIMKSRFDGSGTTDFTGKTWTTPGFQAVAGFGRRPNHMEPYAATTPAATWSYDIPSHGMNCTTAWCYQSGYQTGGDLMYIWGPPGDRASSTQSAAAFGDIEGNNTVSFKTSVLAPPNNWTAEKSKRAPFTVEIDVQCITPKTGGTCNILFGGEGVADTDPAEQRLVNYQIPQDGWWYTCRVDDEHGATLPWNENISFENEHDKYALVIATSDRWVGFDNGFLGNRTKKATNGFPSSNMYATPGCQRIAKTSPLLP